MGEKRLTSWLSAIASYDLMSWGLGVHLECYRYRGRWWWTVAVEIGPLSLALGDGR